MEIVEPENSEFESEEECSFGSEKPWEDEKIGRKRSWSISINESDNES